MALSARMVECEQLFIYLFSYLFVYLFIYLFRIFISFLFNSFQWLLAEGNHSPCDQPDSSAEEVEPTPHQTAELVVQADVRLIRIRDRVPDDNGELVFSLSKPIHPQGKSDLVGCAQYTPHAHASQPCSDRSYPKADACISDAHLNSCNDYLLDPSSPVGMLQSVPVSEEGDLSSLLFQATDTISHSALDSSMVASELSPHSLLKQERISCAQPSTHSLSVVSTEIESIDEYLYLTETQAAVQVEGNTSLLVL